MKVTKEKLEALTKLIDEFNAPKSCIYLMRVLLTQKRIDLLNLVLKNLLLLYKEKHAIEHFTCITSHEIDQATKKKILTFISSRTSNTVECDFTTDKNLIIGIRIESKNYFWERSIRKILTGVYISMLGKGYNYDRKTD